MDGTGVDGHGHDYGRDFEQGYGNDFGNDFEHDRPRADLAIHGTILTHGVETYGTVVVRDGRIASVASDSNGPGANGRAPIDAVETIHLRNDEILIPGIVDTHVHINEPGRTAWEGFACVTRAAAAGGVTLYWTCRSIPFRRRSPSRRCAANGHAHCMNRMSR